MVDPYREWNDSCVSPLFTPNHRCKATLTKIAIVFGLRLQLIVFIAITSQQKSESNDTYSGSYFSNCSGYE